MMVWSADEVHLTDDDVRVGIGATAREVSVGAVGGLPRSRKTRQWRANPYAVLNFAHQP